MFLPGSLRDDWGSPGPTTTMLPGGSGGQGIRYPRVTGATAGRLPAAVPARPPAARNRLTPHQFHRVAGGEGDGEVVVEGDREELDDGGHDGAGDRDAPWEAG